MTGAWLRDKLAEALVCFFFLPNPPPPHLIARFLRGNAAPCWREHMKRAKTLYLINSEDSFSICKTRRDFWWLFFEGNRLVTALWLCFNYMWTEL